MSAACGVPSLRRSKRQRGRERKSMRPLLPGQFLAHGLDTPLPFRLGPPASARARIDPGPTAQLFELVDEFRAFVDQAFALEAGGALLEHFGVAVQAVVERVRGVDLRGRGVSSVPLVLLRIRTRGRGESRTSAAAWRVPRGGSSSVSSRRRNKGFSAGAAACFSSALTISVLASSWFDVALLLLLEVKVAAVVVDEEDCAMV